MDKTNDIVTAILMEPFPAEEIESFPGRGGNRYPYVAGENVLRRLIAATDNKFDVDVLSCESRPLTDKDGMIVGEQWIAKVQLTIPGLGRRTAIGVQNVDARSGEDMIKGVITDGIKKASTYFGVGLELYDDAAPASTTAGAKSAKPSGDWSSFWRWLTDDVKLSPLDYAILVGKTANQFETPKLAYAALIDVAPEYAKPKSSPAEKLAVVR